MRGVGDELPLRADGLLERLEHLVEARSETAELVVALDLDPQAQIVRSRDLLGRVAEATHGRERGARDDCACGDRERDPARCDEGDQQREPVQRVVDLLQRAQHLHGEPLPERRGEDTDVHTADRRVCEVRVAGAARDERRLPVDRDRDRRVGGAEDVAVRLDELDEGVAAALAERGKVREETATGATDKAAPRAVERALRRRGAIAERVVDLAAEVAAHDHVDDRAGDRDGGGHGERDGEGQAGAQAHGSSSRSA